jgi:hypothetical protein
MHNDNEWKSNAGMHKHWHGVGKDVFCNTELMQAELGAQRSTRNAT